jgi:hypothetical protein
MSSIYKYYGYYCFPSRFYDIGLLIKRLETPPPGKIQAAISYCSSTAARCSSHSTGGKFTTEILTFWEHTFHYLFAKSSNED